MCQSQRMPMAYCDATRRMRAAENARLRAFIFILAILSPVTAWCMLRMVIAVAEEVGKIKRSSRAT